MKISVVMSIYSEPVEWISEAIDSILNQTFSDFEFIIINDKPDRIENVTLLSQYERKDKRIVIISNEENIGLTKSLNKGLKIAKGKYIARMDADDISLLTRFEKQFSFMEDNEDIIACSCEVETFGRKKMYWKLEKEDKDLRNHFLLPSPITTPLCHPASFIRNRVLKENKIFYDENITSAQDYDFWRQLLLVGKLANIGEILFKYRLSDVNISSTKRVEQKANTKLIRRKYIKTLLEKLNVNYIVPNRISLDDIRKFKKGVKNLELTKEQKLDLNNLLICMYLSLPHYTVKTVFYYILSLDCFILGVPFKERIRLFYRFIKRDSQLSYL